MDWVDPATAGFVGTVYGTSANSLARAASMVAVRPASAGGSTENKSASDTATMATLSAADSDVVAISKTASTGDTLCIVGTDTVAIGLTETASIRVVLATADAGSVVLEV